MSLSSQPCGCYSMSANQDAIANSDRDGGTLRAYAVLIAIAIVGALVLPRSAAIWLAVLAGTVIASASGGVRIADVRALPLLAVTMLAFCAYALVNSLWAVDPLESLGKVASLLLIAVTVHLAIVALPAAPAERTTAIGRAAAAALCIGTAFLCVEVLTDQAIMRTIFDVLPFLRGSPKHVKIAADGSVDKIGLYVLNRNLAALNLVLWPGLALLTLTFAKRHAMLVASGVLIVATVAVYRSEHETSMLALPAAMLAFVQARASARWALGLLTTGWVVATLLVAPLTLVAYANDLHLAKWIPETGRNRIILWSYTTEQWRNAPILGIGVASTKSLDDKNAPTAVKPDGFTYPLRTGRHAHNIYLQTWYELGIVGAVLLLAVGLAILRTMGRMPERIMPFALAGFASAAVTAAFSWGLWQVWFMALFGLFALLTAIAVQLTRPSAR